MKNFTGSLLCFGLLAIGLWSCGDDSNKNKKESGALPEAEWKTGVALYSFNHFRFAEALNKSDSAGAKYVEGFSFHQLGKEFSDSSMSAMTEEMIDRMKAMLDQKKIKMESMYVGSARTAADWQYYFGIGKKFGMQYLVCEPAKEEWDMLDSLAGVNGINIAIHEHAKGKSMYWHPDSVLAALKNHPNFGACADLGHWVRSGLDPVDCLKMLEGHILGVHLKDISESNNVEAEDVLVGTGNIDFKAVVGELSRQHFKGGVHVECEHKMDNNLDDVKEALRYFNALSQK